jgi:hypothetical protein
MGRAADGLDREGIRLPMTRFSAEFHDRLRLAMREAGIAFESEASR